MTILENLQSRSENKCELCKSEMGLGVYEVPGKIDVAMDESILVCSTCLAQIENPQSVEVNHWRCLNESMWSQISAVQVMAWRMLKQLSNEAWALNLFESLYMEDEVLAWAQVLDADEEITDTLRHLDSNGALLEAGDNVTIIKDLNVKGANFAAKRGTAVRGISLVKDNAEQIEGRVNGQQIVILTKFVKKLN